MSTDNTGLEWTMLSETEQVINWFSVYPRQQVVLKKFVDKICMICYRVVPDNITK